MTDSVFLCCFTCLWHVCFLLRKKPIRPYFFCIIPWLLILLEFNFVTKVFFNEFGESLLKYIKHKNMHFSLDWIIFRAKQISRISVIKFCEWTKNIFFATYRFRQLLNWRTICKIRKNLLTIEYSKTSTVYEANVVSLHDKDYGT